MRGAKKETRGGRKRAEEGSKKKGKKQTRRAKVLVVAISREARPRGRGWGGWRESNKDKNEGRERVKSR